MYLNMPLAEVERVTKAGVKEARKEATEKLNPKPRTSRATEKVSAIASAYSHFDPVFAKLSKEAILWTECGEVGFCAGRRAKRR